MLTVVKHKENLGGLLVARKVLVVVDTLAGNSCHQDHSPLYRTQHLKLLVEIVVVEGAVTRAVREGTPHYFGAYFSNSLSLLSTLSSVLMLYPLP